MNKDIDIANKVCTDCMYVKVNFKSKYKNPDLHCARRNNCKLTGKEEAKWCSLYKEME